jgi:hypothetical protein
MKIPEYESNDLFQGQEEGPQGSWSGFMSKFQTIYGTGLRV